MPTKISSTEYLSFCIILPKHSAGFFSRDGACSISHGENTVCSLEEARKLRSSPSTVWIRDINRVASSHSVSEFGSLFLCASRCQCCVWLNDPSSEGFYSLHTDSVALWFCLILPQWYLLLWSLGNICPITSVFFSSLGSLVSISSYSICWV